jgi:hypothetical protein
MTSDPERDFEMAGNNPLAWWLSAETLLRAASRIRETTVPYIDRGQTFMSSESSVYGLLLGYAIECLLKARLVVNGHKFVDENGNFRKPQAPDHNLLRLAELAAVVLTDPERDAIDRLSSLVLFAGRYPIPTKSTQLSWKRTADGVDITPRFYRVEDFALAELVAARLQVGPWPWGEMPSTLASAEAAD